MKTFRLYTILFLLFTLAVLQVRAQNPRNIIQGIGNRVGSIGGSSSGSAGSNDSLLHRNMHEDSLTLNIYQMDSTGARHADSSINDFTVRFPIPSTHIYLGNIGNATRSLLFAPASRIGFDPGFHAFDVYKFNLEKVRFFNTTRPFTELSYMLGSRAEQIIEIFHTQNIKPYWNFALNYRLINAPGFFRNQKTNHNNYLFNSWYQAPGKRYNNFFVLLGNRLQSGENGGLVNVEDLNSSNYIKDRYLIPTQIGGDPVVSTDFFSTVLYTGNQYREFNIFLRQQYDFGRKDSVVTDSTVIPLFYPRLRFEHTFLYGKYTYSYLDIPASGKQNNLPDSAWYYSHYGVSIPESQSLLFQDKWKEISNDFSIYQFPDAKNLRQYIKLGAQLQLLKGSFFKDSASLPSTSLYNIIGHGEYRNRTRNQKWDIEALGKFYFAGYNLGDYQAYISLQRLLSKTLGSLRLGFESINRSPSFIYDERSGFYLDIPKSFSKENSNHLFANLFLPRLKLQLSGDYYLITNYLYITQFYKLQQESTIFNVLRVNASKNFKVARHWNWVVDLYLQQKTGTAQLHIPTVFTRNRFYYEGNLGFRNLNIAFGIDARYHSPYKADGYSPVLGQFTYQDTTTISNFPDVAAFLHFRIRTFRAFIRAENLNTLNFDQGLHFNRNNLAAPNYPTPGLILRLGIYWGFVN